MSYKEVFFFTDGNILNGDITYGNVKGIYYDGEETAYGICKGMTIEQVEEILGTPSGIHISYYSELYKENNTIMKYEAEDYTVIIEIDDKGKTVQSISIWRKEDSDSLSNPDDE